MTKKPSTNGFRLTKASNEKAAFIHFIERKLNLSPSCSVVDLDILTNIQTLPKAEYAFWLDWHLIVDLLGEPDDAEEGLKKAQDGLWIASCKYDNLFFAADGNHPPLDQYCQEGGKSLTLQMFFKNSSCYKSIIPFELYKGRVVYWGSNPSTRWTDEECKQNDIRAIRLAQNDSDYW